MASMNKALLLGNLGRDPELRNTQAGTPVLSFPMATSRSWKDRESGAVRSTTDWHRIVVWGQQAEILAEHLRKGSQVHIEGRLQTRSWADGEGTKRHTTEIVASRVQLLGRPQDRESAEAAEEHKIPPDEKEPDGVDAYSADRDRPIR